MWAAVLILAQDSFEKVNRGSVGPLWGCVLQAVRPDSLGHSLLSEMEEKRGGRLAGCQMISLIRSLNSSSDHPASPQHYWQTVRPSHPSGNIRQSGRQDPGLLGPPRAVHVCPSAVRVCPAPIGERREKESRAEDPGRQTLQWTREVQEECDRGQRICRTSVSWVNTEMFTFFFSYWVTDLSEIFDMLCPIYIWYALKKVPFVLNKNKTKSKSTHNTKILSFLQYIIKYAYLEN